MKHVSSPAWQACRKYVILPVALCIIAVTSAKAQQVYTDQELLSKGLTYYNHNDYELAEIFLFAYIQKNTSSYKSSVQFRDQINAALLYSVSQISGPTVIGKFDKSYPQDAQGHHIYHGPIRKPGVGPAPPVVNATVTPGSYSCDDGNTYYIAVNNNEVWCVGKNNEGNWVNVIHGNIVGTQLIASWISQPSTGSTTSGTISWNIDNNTFTIADQTGGFTGTSLTQNTQKQKAKKK
jgi:hypothetical protein